MSDDTERSAAMRGSLPAALADYKQLAKDCGVDEGIDLPVVAMAFVHGAAYGAKHPTLTDEEREAIEKAIGRELDAEWYGGPEPVRVVALRGVLERLK
jgi:hypothetical protein